jgi:Putative prokaryotic signal transducing protein
MAEPDREELREVTSVWGKAEAAVVMAFLASHGISCVPRGRILQDIYPISVDGLGEIKLFVLAKDFEAAKALLEELPKPEDIEDFEKDGEGGA